MQAAPSLGGNSGENGNSLFDKRLRQEEGAKAACRGFWASAPAHPSNRLIAQLNAAWRIMDDPLQ
jgi:hypothetical protein